MWVGLNHAECIQIALEWYLSKLLAPQNLQCTFPTFEFGKNKTDRCFVEVVQWRPLPHPGATISNQIYKILLPPCLYMYTSIFHPQGKFCFIIQIYNYCGVLLMLILHSKFIVSAETACQRPYL